MATITKASEIPMEREKLQLLLLENPNYFGTLQEKDAIAAKFKPVLIKKGDTAYEQLTCVGYNPELQDLTGIVNIKLNGGYNGGFCTQGSKEYVRFFINYGGGWQDLGVTSFDVHDTPHTGENPLDYAVNLHFVPNLAHCCFEAAVLPKVRAILSWNFMPPAGNHNFIPVWGNILDVNIQIAPSHSIICLLKQGLAGIGVSISEEKAAVLSQTLASATADPDAFNQISAASDKELSLAELVKAYGKEVEPARVGFTTIAKSLSFGAANIDQVHAEFKTVGFDIAKIMATIIKPNYNTTYEELKCVGLNRDTSVLNATFNVKKTAGYSGGLCSKGSREYVAFYMDFGSGWVYMGTSSVGVHDITPLPGGGISYDVELPVNLAPYQKQSCKDVYLARVKAILSWNQLPPINPNWVPVWGNAIQAWVEVGYSIFTGGESLPFITSIGTFPATKVNTFTGLVDKTWGAPDASVDAYDGYSFNGAIPITGIITSPPDSNNNPINEMRYRIMLKKASQPITAYAPVTNTFNVLKTVISGGIPTSAVVPQVNNLGYYNYLVDFTPPTIVTVYGDLLGELLLPDSDLYEFYIETEAGFTTSVYSVKTDVHAPINVHINIDGGQDCGTLKQGNPVTGTYSIADIENNCLGVSFEILYYPPGTSSALTVDGAAQGFDTIVPVPAVGKSGVWAITTDHLTPCGYNLRMYAYDKTIVCYHTLSYAYGITSQYTYDTLGFCLAKP
jgi:hypothetical protein